ncbi:hypothetical protein D3C87_1835690 [compost metagenome]
MQQVADRIRIFERMGRIDTKESPAVVAQLFYGQERGYRTARDLLCHTFQRMAQSSRLQRLGHTKGHENKCQDKTDWQQNPGDCPDHIHEEVPQGLPG